MARKGVPVHGDLHSELKNGVKLCECVSHPVFVDYLFVNVVCVYAVWVIGNW
jgi:hypothetical protein